MAYINRIFEEFTFPNRFNEMDYTQTSDGTEYINNDNGNQLIWQRREEDIKRESEARERERRNRLNELHERLGRQLHDGMQHGFQNTSSDLKSKRETLTERLALKYCFFMSRMMMVVSGKFEYSEGLSKKLSTATDYFSKDSVRNKIYASILKEGSKNGISHKEIDEEITRINSKFGSNDVGEMFIKHFVGLVAIRKLIENPKVVKDTGNIKKSQTHETKDGYGANHIDGWVGIMRRLQEMQETEKKTTEINSDWIQRTWIGGPPSYVDVSLDNEDCVSYANYVAPPIGGCEKSIPEQKKHSNSSILNYIKNLQKIV